MVSQTAALMTVSPDPEATEWTCALFVRCPNEAVGWVDTLTFGALPCCARCACILGEILAYQCATCGSITAPSAAVLAYSCGTRPDGGIECTECATEHVAAGCTGCDVADRDAQES